MHVSHGAIWPRLRYRSDSDVSHVRLVADNVVSTMGRVSILYHAVGSSFLGTWFSTTLQARRHPSTLQYRLYFPKE